MAKKPASRETQTLAPLPWSFSERFANPAAIIEHIEDESTGCAPEDPYRQRIEMIMGLQLPKSGDPDGIEEAAYLRMFRGGLTLEEAARRTGFILGFEYCRDLILAGAKTGGAR